MKNITEKAKKEINNIINLCAEIIKQDNVIVYPSAEVHSIQTYYHVDIMNKDGIPQDTIFTVDGPSNGYGIRITSTGVYISGYDLGLDKNKLIKLYSDCETKSDKQKQLREKIAEQKYAKLLSETKQGLAKFTLPKTK